MIDKYDNPFKHYRKPEQPVTRNEYEDLLARLAALEDIATKPEPAKRSRTNKED